MTIENAPTEGGKEGARGPYKAIRADEREVEAEKSSDLAKGADRLAFHDWEAIRTVLAERNAGEERLRIAAIVTGRAFTRR